MSDLKSCPFCGSAAIVKDLGDATFVCCVDCDASTAMWYESTGDATTAWNTRAESKETCDSCRWWEEKEAGCGECDSGSNSLGNFGFQENWMSIDCCGSSFGCIHHEAKP
jgi:Lar family restriction alleviation protein